MHIFTKKVCILLICVVLFLCFGVLFSSCSSNIEDSMMSVLEIAIIDEDGEIVNQGTGFCIVNNYTMMSAAHLFENIKQDDKIIGTALSGEQYFLTISSINTETDIALLNITDKYLEPLEVAKTLPNNLEDIYIIGNTKGYGLSYNKGIVSMRKKNFTIHAKTKTVMQTNITINPGDSGAPVLNTSNQLVGMISFKLMNNDGQGVDGISFAVILEDILNEINS